MGIVILGAAFIVCVGICELIFLGSHFYFLLVHKEEFTRKTIGRNLAIKFLILFLFALIVVFAKSGYVTFFWWLTVFLLVIEHILTFGKIVKNNTTIYRIHFAITVYFLLLLLILIGFSSLLLFQIYSY